MGLPFGEWLAGLIWAIAAGLAMGNYATTLIHRLPRHESITSNKPRCGNCGTPLAPRDLLPVISWFLLKGTCRFCGATIPRLHLWTELTMALVFALCYTEYLFSEEFILITGIAFFLITLTIIEINERILQPAMWAGALACGVLYRMLQDVSIYGFISGGLSAMLLAGGLWQVQRWWSGHTIAFPGYGMLIILAGACLHLFSFLTVIMVWLTGLLFIHVLRWKKYIAAVPLTPAFSLVMVIVLLYPALADYLRKYFWQTLASSGV